MAANVLYYEFKHLLQAKFIKDHVVIPLETLVGLFQNPFHLIQKRKDKLLDYDHMQYALDRADDPEKIAQLREETLLAKRNYEALNAQLLEELPHFIDSVVKMLQHQLTVLVQGLYSFHTSVVAIFPPLLSLSEAIGSSAEVRQDHTDQLASFCKNLAKLTIVPSSLSMNFSLRATTPRRTPVEGSTSSSQPASSSTSPADKEPTLDEADDDDDEDNNDYCVDGDSNDASEDEEEEEEKEGGSEESPAIGTQLRVLYDFEAQDSAELSVLAGQTVQLLCAHDRLGCKEWWLVKDQENQGYVPAAYFTQL